MYSCEDSDVFTHAEWCEFAAILCMSETDTMWEDAEGRFYKKEEVDACVAEAYWHLMNVQPHIAQGLENKERCAQFIDAHIQLAMESLNVKE